MLDNKKVNGVHYTRIIASFCKFSKNPFIFEDWLKSLRVDDFGAPNPNGRKLTRDEINDLIEMFGCGKLEFETNARAFVKFAEKLYSDVDEYDKFIENLEKEWEGAE